MTGALAMGLSSAPDGLSKIYEGKFSSVTKEAGSLKLLNWNIERGLQLGGIGAAIEREKQLKGWRRSKKVELIEAVNPLWSDLSQEWDERAEG